MIKAISTSRKRAPFKKKEGPTDIDTYVGQQLRFQRVLQGLTQEDLAQATGLTFQQIQKYEMGKNRVGASRLFQLSNLLDVEPNFFFPAPYVAARRLGLAEDQEKFTGPTTGDVLQNKETIELLRAYYSVKDVKKRKNLLKIVQQIAEGTTEV